MLKIFSIVQKRQVFASENGIGLVDFVLRQLVTMHRIAMELLTKGLGI